MSIDHVLAVVPVTDLEASREWYSSLFGRAPDNNPMPSLSEWQVRAGAWVQVFVDTERAGSGLLNFAVSDLDSHIGELQGRGLAPESVIEASKGVRLSTLIDPDGNTIRLIGGFHVDYPE
jgi:catechol 2,3-dioxygenase-like lactoylglutathione lyase family enzyme